MALALRTMVIPTAANDTLYSYAGHKPRREWVVHLQVGGRVGRLRGCKGGGQALGPPHAPFLCGPAAEAARRVALPPSLHSPA